MKTLLILLSVFAISCCGCSYSITPAGIHECTSLIDTAAPKYRFDSEAETTELFIDQKGSALVFYDLLSKRRVKLAAGTDATYKCDCIKEY